MMDFERFKFQFGRLTAAFPRKNPSTATAEVYYDALRSRLSADDLERSVGRAIAEGEYFPTVAKLLGYAQGGVDDRYPRAVPYTAVELRAAIGETNVETFVAAQEREDIYALAAIRDMLERTGQLEPAAGQWWD